MKKIFLLIGLLHILFSPIARAVNELPELNSSASYSYSSREMQLALSMYVNAFYKISKDYELKFFWEQAIRDLMLYTKMNPNDLMVVVIEDPTINAFAMPGLVGLNTGILTKIDNFEEAVFIFSHELAHVQQGHHSRKYEDQNTNSSLLGYLAALALGGAPLLLGSVVATRERGLSFNRDMEYEADTVGTSIMNKAGYDPKYAVSSLEELDTYKDYEFAKNMEYFQTHPITSNRIKEARTQVSSMEKNSDVAYSRVRREANSKSFLLFKEKYKVKEMSSEERENYIKKISSKPNASEQELFGLAYAYRDSQNFAGSKKISTKLLKKSQLNSLYSHLHAENLHNLGQDKEAIEQILSYLSLNTTNAPHQLLLADIYINIKKWKQAEQTLLKILPTMKMVPDYWDRLMIINQKLKNNYYFYFSYASKLFSMGRLKECQETLQAGLKLADTPDKKIQIEQMQALVKIFLKE